MTSVSAATGIVARDVCKSFGEHVVLDKVSLAVEEGTILALLGPNGAGKTTMVRILSTLIPADSGSMRIAGHDVVTDPDGVRAIIGVTGEILGGGQPAHRRREPATDGRPSPPRPRGWATTSGRVVGAVRPDRRRPQAAFDLLRRDATTPRPRDDPRRISRG